MAAGWARAHLRLHAATLAVLAAVVAAGLTLRFGFDHPLGSALSPFVMGFKPRLAWWMAAAVGLAAAFLGAVPALLRVSVPAFVASLAAAALALALTLNAGRVGTGDWDAVFRLRDGSFEAIHEYLPALPRLARGAGWFLAHFDRLVPHVPVNVAGHPPGLLVTLWLTGLATPGRMAALCIACAAAVPPLTYALGRELLPERSARTAALLGVACPCLLLFGTTSADAVYAAVATASAALLVRPGLGARAAGAALLGAGTLLTWAMPAVAAWAVVVAWRREGRRAAFAVAGLCAAGVIGVLGTVAVAWGFDPLGALRATDAAYRASLARHRPYWFWVLGSPVAWALLVGPPIVLAALAAARRRAPAALALAAVVAVAAVGGYTKAETERIWLIFVGLVCVAAAEAGLASRRPRGVLAILLAEAAVVQALFYTVW